LAYLFSDSFDFYNAVAQLSTRWDTVVGTWTLINTVVPFGTGNSVQEGNANLCSLTKDWGSNEGTVFISIYHRGDNGRAYGSYGWITLQDGATSQVSIVWQENGTLEVRNGSQTGTVLGSNVRAIPMGVWESFQIKVVIGAAGSVEIRKNGSTTPILNLTGVNTRTTANDRATRIQLGIDTLVNNEGDIYFDDLFVCSGSGAAPNDWPGDPRAIRQPASSVVGSTSFTPSATSTIYGQLSTAAAVTVSANTIMNVRTTAPTTGSITHATLKVNTALTGSLVFGIYNNDGVGGLAKSRLYLASPLVNPGVGDHVYTITPAISVTRGQTIYAMVTPSANASLRGTSSIGSTRGILHSAYASGLPETIVPIPISVSSTSAFYVDLTLSNNSDAEMVGEIIADVDNTYVQGTVGHTSLYGVTSVPAAINRVVGTVPFAVMRRTSTATRTVELEIKSGTVTSTVLTASTAIGTTYTASSIFVNADPAISGSWTVSAVNALQVGQKVIS